MKIVPLAVSGCWRTLATLQECDSGSIFFGDYDVLGRRYMLSYELKFR